MIDIFFIDNKVQADYIVRFAEGSRSLGTI